MSENLAANTIDKPTEVAPATSSEVALTQGPPASAAQQPNKTPPKKHSWLFDTIVYAGIVNTAVFLLSVFVTYETTYGKEGNWLRKRGDKSRKSVANKFEQWFAFGEERAQKSAKMAMMVFWSWVDGSLLAPVAAWLETKRPNETKEELNDAEAQRSLKSLILGRAATAGIVVPTAVGLGALGLNDAIFYNPGKRLGNWLSNLSVTKRLFPKMAEKMVIDSEQKSVKFLEAMGTISTFEIFYTSVCTLGLWASSKWIAQLFHKNKTKPEDKKNIAANPETITNQVSEPIQQAAYTYDAGPSPLPTTVWTDKKFTAPKESFVQRSEERPTSQLAATM